MIDDLISALVLLVMGLVLPHRATCPDGYYASGVRPDGRSTCREIPPTRDCGEPKWSPPCPEPRSFPIRIYCTGGTIPLVDAAGVTISCQMRH